MKRSPSSPGSAPTTTPALSRAATSHPPTPSSTPSPAPSSSTTPAAAHLQHLANPGPTSAPTDPDGTTGPASRTAPCSTPGPARPRSSSAAAATYSPPIRWRRALLADFDAMPYRDRKPHPSGSSFDPRRARALRRLGPDRVRRWWRSSASMPAPTPTTPEPPNWLASSPSKSPEFPPLVVPAQGAGPHLGLQAVPPSRRRTSRDRLTRPSTCPATQTRRCSCTAPLTATPLPPTHSSSLASWNAQTTVDRPGLSVDRGLLSAECALIPRRRRLAVGD